MKGPTRTRSWVGAHLLGDRLWTRTVWIILLGATAIACVVPTFALAHIGGHILKASFGSAGSGDGQVELAEHSSLAINEASHDIYVADTGNRRVDQFSSTGTFIRAFGADVGGTGIDVCTSGCVAGTSESSPGAFEEPAFIAIDNSGGASDGDVYVADTANSRVSKFDAEGNLITSWGAGGQLDGSTATNGPFGEIAGIAVDSAGTLDVFEVEPHLLFQFAQDGSFSGELTLGERGTSAVGLAVDSAGHLFKVNGNKTIEKFRSDGTDVGQVDPEPASGTASTTGIAVDSATSELYVDQGGSIDDYAFGPLGEVIGSAGCFPHGGAGCPPTASFGTGDLSSGAGVAVDGTSHSVYGADAGAGEIVVFAPVILPDASTEAATEIDKESATLHGTVSAAGGPETSCEFQYTTQEAFSAKGFEGAINLACSPPGPFTGSGSEAVSAEIGELDPATKYCFRVVANSENGSTPELSSKDGALCFQTLGPSVIAGSASQITSTSARLSGQVNPNGEATDFFFEYDTAEYKDGEGPHGTRVPVPPQEVGGGTEFVEVIQQLTGLAPDAVYHFRLVASSPAATVQGPDKEFTTFPVRAGLPDGRAYELVSPAQKLGEVIPPEAALVTLGGSCQDCVPGMFLAIMPMQSAPDGEAVLFEGQPFSGGLSSGPNEYLASRNSSGWLTQGLSEPLFEIGANGQGYKAFSTDLARGVLFQVEPLSPLAPTREGRGFANLYLRDEGGSLQPLVIEEPPNRSPGHEGSNHFQILFASANAGAGLSPAFSHIVFQANDSLTKDVPGVAPPAPEVAETEKECSTPGTGCNLYEWVGGHLRLVNVLPNNISAVPGGVLGSGRLLAGLEEGSAVDHAISDDGNRIFWSEEESGQLYVRIDGNETRKIKDPGLFLTATPAGSKVLLSDGCLYDLEEKECEDLTLDENKVHQGGFEGILGAAEDLSRVYFVDTAVLTEEENENCKELAGEVICEQAKEGNFNLYAWHEGTTSFIGTLKAIDNRGAGGRDWRPFRSIRGAQVSADGSYLAFMSSAPLTGYDNAVSGGGECKLNLGSPLCPEVFVYAASSGTLTCASCNPSGERPLGLSTLSVLEGGRSGFPPFPQPGNLSSAGRGRVFFQSLDALSPRDTNGKVQDVYEWEPNGVGSCERAAGCIFLISSGKSPNDSMFLDSTPSGNDAFFITGQRLVPADTDEQLDLYDARVGGGFPEVPSAPCEGETCRGPASSPPPLGGLGSRESSGPGNPPRQNKKKHKKKHKKRHKRTASHNRGGSK